MEQAIRDQVARVLDIPVEDQAILDRGGDHPADCHCGTCLRYWRLVGPDPSDLSRPYGPFAIEDVEIDSARGQRCRDDRLLLHIMENDRPECVRFVDTASGLPYRWRDDEGHWDFGGHVLACDDSFWPVGADGKQLSGRLEWNDDGD